jgi:hypothetical protein
MALSKRDVEQWDKDFNADLKGIPLGKILCVAKAAWKAYRCETEGGTHCIETLVKDIEVCLKG